MLNRYRIKIDLNALCAHLSRAEARRVRTDEVLKWLADAGFNREGTHWTVAEADLGQLEPLEVLEIELLGEPGK